MSNCSSDATYFASPSFLLLTTRIITCFEIPIWIFGAYCIQFKTPEKMKSVKGLMLNVHFWSTISDLTICCIGVPYLHLPCLAGYGLGLVQAPGPLLYLGFTFLGAFAVSIIAVYENRLLTVINPTSRWHKFRKAYLPLMCLFPPTYTIPIFASLPEQEHAREHVLKSIPCLKVFSLNFQELFVLTLKPIVPAICGVFAASIAIFPIVIFFTLTFRQLLKRQKNYKYSYRTVRVQKNFLVSMSLQFVFIMTFMFIPCVLLLYIVIFKYHNQILNNFIIILFSCFGTGSTVVIILVYKPYREFAFLVLTCSRSRKVENVVVPAILT